MQQRPIWVQGTSHELGFYPKLNPVRAESIDEMTLAIAKAMAEKDSAKFIIDTIPTANRL